jgi:hypothetical protein
MTLEPAAVRCCRPRGVDRVGKDATLIVTDGDILDLRSHVVPLSTGARSI